MKANGVLQVLVLVLPVVVHGALLSVFFSGWLDSTVRA
jgi:hypothetical protein